MPLRDDLLNPIPGENPSGESLRYAPVFDKIKEARRADDDAPQGDWQFERKTADYPLVIKLAGEALATKSKDLQVAAWLTEAILRKEGFRGLRAGLELIKGLVENFWDTLLPGAGRRRRRDARSPFGVAGHPHGFGAAQRPAYEQGRELVPVQGIARGGV